jgi:hypothetical protein
MSARSVTALIASAIQKADTSYFNEDYTKQAQAVLAALEQAGYQLMPKEYPPETWAKAADAMKTGRVRPEEHVKNVYEVVLKVAAVK